MISNEQKYILDLIRGVESKYSNKVSPQILMDELLRHRLFLSLYQKASLKLSKMSSKIYSINRDNIIKIKQKQYDFFKILISKFNSFNIEYIVLKGFANETRLFGGNNGRMFGDFDIFVKPENLEEAVRCLLTAFPDSDFIDNCDYYAHEVRVVIKHGDQNFLVELKRRHRGCTLDKNDYFFSNVVQSKLDDGVTIYPVLNDEALLYSSIVYLYNYFSRKTAYLYSKKNRLCYFYEFYVLTKSIDFNKLLNNILKRQEINNEIYNVLSWTNTIFNHDHFHVDIDLKPVFPFNIIDCVFNSDMIANIYKNHYLNEFNLDQTLTNNFKIIHKDGEIHGEIAISKNLLKLRFNINLLRRDGSQLIYLSLCCKNIYGEPFYPFLPISIRLCEDNVKIFNKFTISHERGTFTPSSEVDMPYHQPNTFNYSIQDDILEVSANLKKLYVSHLNAEIFSYNIELVEICDDNNIVVIARVNDEIEDHNFIKIE